MLIIKVNPPFLYSSMKFFFIKVLADFSHKKVALKISCAPMKNVFWVLGGGKGYFRHPSKLF